MAKALADRALRRHVDDTLVLYRLRKLTLALREFRRWYRQAALLRTFVAVGAIVGIAVLIEWLTTRSWGWPSWASLGLTLVVLLAGGLVGAATIAQRRIVIESFADHAHQPDQVDAVAAGLPALVRQELNRLRQLYDPPSRRVGLEAVNLGVDKVGGQGLMLLEVTGGDVNETLRTAITADSKVTVGFLSVPVAPALALLERVLQGPRIAGSLHRDGTDLVLTAQLRRRGGQRTWLLREQAIDESHAMGELARGLAGLVTAHLLHGPTLGPQAIEHFHAGLQHYADAQRQPARRLAHLHRAQDCFLDAAASDPSFGWASFNLGLVYHELAIDAAGLPTAQSLYAGAELCFDRAIQTDPQRWEFRHARCVVARDQNDLQEGMQHAEQALKLARTWLKRAKSGYQLGLMLGWDHDAGSPTDMLEMRRRAARWARRALVAADLRDTDDADAAATGASTLLSLGIACANRGLVMQGPARRRWTDAARRALDHAATLRPDDPNVPFQLSNVEKYLGEPGRMLDAARRATALDQDHLRAWLAAALAASRLGNGSEVQRCLQAIAWAPSRAIAPGADGRAPLRHLTDAWREWWPALPPPNVPLLPLRYLEEVMNRFEALASMTAEELEDRIANPLSPPAFAPDLARWEQAMAHLRLAHGSFQPAGSRQVDECDRVADRLQQAVDLLSIDQLSEIVYLGLRPSIAQLRRRANWLSAQGRGSDLFAVREFLVKATEEAPFDASAHAQLGLVQLDLNDPPAAENALRTALDCWATGGVSHWPHVEPLPHLPIAEEGNVADLLGQLAGVLLVRADRAGPSERDALRQEALALLADATGEAGSMKSAWRLWFRLGRARRDTLDFRGALKAFELAWQANEDAPLCALFAAESAHSSDEYPSAVVWSNTAIERAELQQNAGEPLGFDVEAQLTPQDIVALATWIKGCVALQRDDPLAAFRLAHQTICRAGPGSQAKAFGYALLGESRRLWSARHDGHRRRHLESALAAYRTAEAITVSFELAEYEAATLAELAELEGDTRRAAARRDQASNLLVLAERLDVAHQRDRERRLVASRLIPGNGAPPEDAEP